jgi:hypothetical protein
MFTLGLGTGARRARHRLPRTDEPLALAQARRRSPASKLHEKPVVQYEIARAEGALRRRAYLYESVSAPSNAPRAAR